MERREGKGEGRMEEGSIEREKGGRGMELCGNSKCDSPVLQFTLEWFNSKLPPSPDRFGGLEL